MLNINVQLSLIPEDGKGFEMMGSAKRNSLILLGLVMMITMMIAASLPQLEFQPGMPLPKLVDNQLVVPPAEALPTGAISVNKFILVFVALLVTVSILHMLYKLFRGARWKDITTIIGPMVVILSIVSGLLLLIMLLPRSAGPIVMEQPIPPPELPVRSSLGPVPPWLFWVVGFGLLAVGILIGIWIIRSASSRTSAIDLVGFEAEKAWQEIKTGVGLKGVIIKCYRQMSLALEKEQGIEREESMTTGEFENLLEAAGFPYDPIHQLTRLFEAVRYGNWQPNPLDEQNAIHFLEAIMLFSRKAKEMN
jgi:hypothetical protein